MDFRLSLHHLRSQLLRTSTTTTTITTRVFLSNSSSRVVSTIIKRFNPSHISPLSDLTTISDVRFFSTIRRNLTPPKPIGIGAQPHQLQTRRLWTYALTFSCIAGSQRITKFNNTSSIITSTHPYPFNCS